MLEVHVRCSLLSGDCESMIGPRWQSQEMAAALLRLRLGKQRDCETGRLVCQAQVRSRLEVELLDGRLLGHCDLGSWAPHARVRLVCVAALPSDLRARGWVCLACGPCAGRDRSPFDE